MSSGLRGGGCAVFEGVLLGLGMTTNETAVEVAPPAAEFSVRDFLKFLLPSLLGVAFFLVPVSIGGSINIGMGVLAEGLKALLDGMLPAIAVVVLCVSVLITLYAKLAGPGWVGMRVLGAAFGVMTYFQVGFGVVTAPVTGGVMLDELAPVLLTFFFFAALLLPFLVEFGLMEFIGSLARRPFRFLFNLPGRSAIDATASWMGSATVGVLITTQQYERGYYNRRESAVIATNFSIVSIAFALLITNFIGINHLFVQFYITVVVAGLTAALIVPRLPPLSRKPDTYHEPVGCQLVEESVEGRGLLRHSLLLAMRRAHYAPGPRQLLRNALYNVGDIFFGLLPLVFAIGTVGLILAEFTPLFTWLSYPMVPILELLRIPEAEAAAPATLVGFAEMFLPAVLAANIESELTRFVIACLSLTQLIYMSEIGALILKSKIPLALWELAVIFLLRTAITLPIIAFMAHTFFF